MKWVKIKLNQIKCWFLGKKGELRNSNTSHRRVENQQIQSTYLSFEFRIKPGTLVQSECSHQIIRLFIKNWSSRRIQQRNRRIIMKGQSSRRKHAKISWRIQWRRWRSLRSPMPNEHPELDHFVIPVPTLGQSYTFFFIMKLMNTNSDQIGSMTQVLLRSLSSGMMDISIYSLHDLGVSSNLVVMIITYGIAFLLSCWSKVSSG